MLQAIIICPGPTLRRDLESALNDSGSTSISRSLEFYPGGPELVRLIRSTAPEVIFLSMELLDSALAVQTIIQSNFAGLQVVAVHSSTDPAVLLATLRAGIHEFVAAPFPQVELHAIVEKISQALALAPPDYGFTDKVFSFLPAKPGSGSSTVSLHTMKTLSGNVQGGTLLLDLDLYSGILGFLLKIEGGHSANHAIAEAHKLDDEVWSQLVTRHQTLDVVPAAPISAPLHVSPESTRQLVESARRRYGAIGIDLSGAHQDWVLEVLRESKHILMVTTPEVAALRLAREKAVFLRSHGLEERLSLVLNRVSGRRSEMSAKEVEQVVGAPVIAEFPSDYGAACRAVQEGGLIPRFEEPAQRLGSFLLSPRAVVAERRKRFLEYFSIVPSVYRPAVSHPAAAC